MGNSGCVYLVFTSKKNSVEAFAEGLPELDDSSEEVLFPVPCVRIVIVMIKTL